MARHRIAEKRSIHLAVEIFAGIFRDRRRIHFFETIVIVIPLLQHERHPTDLVLYADKAKLRVALQDSVKDQLKKSVRDFLELEVDAASIGLDSGPFLTEHGFLMIAMSREDVQIDGHI